MICPACEKGLIGDNRICDRCGVGVPKGAEIPLELMPVNRKRRVVKHAVREQLWETDYARTKEDKK